MNLSTRIELLDRIPFEQLEIRWASEPTFPKGLALKKVQDGCLRAQFYGYLVESGPGAGQSHGNSSHAAGGVREPEWLTLQTKWAVRFLSGSKFALPVRMEFGYPAQELLDPTTLPVAGEGCHFHVVTEARNLFEAGRIEIVTEDILKVEEKLAPCRVVTESFRSATLTAPCPVEPELRGNNHRVQTNILEAAIITLGEAIKAGTARNFVHTSGKYSGLNATRLSREIDDQRHQFHALQSEEADGTPPLGASVEAIQELITAAQKQLVSKNTTKSTPRKNT